MCECSEKGRSLLLCYFVLKFGLMYIIVVYVYIMILVYLCIGICVIMFSVYLFLFDILMCDCWFYYVIICCRFIL